MKTCKPVLTFAALLLGGCIPVLSLHPLYRQADVVFDQALLGTWGDPNDDGPSWKFSRLENADQVLSKDEVKEVSDKVYELTLSDEKGHKGRFVACLIKLSGGLFLDVYPAQFPSGQTEVEEMTLMYNAFLFIPAHTFLRIDSIGSQLKMCMTDDDSLKKLLDEEPNAIGHEDLDGMPILTAPTAKLQAFVCRHASDKRLFGGAEMVLNRVSASAGKDNPAGGAAQKP